jgi:hypothetical protein
LSSTVKGAVQPTPFWHTGWPGCPQVPPMQPPAVQVPSIIEHIDPARTQVLVL